MEQWAYCSEPSELTSFEASPWHFLLERLKQTYGLGQWVIQHSGAIRKTSESDWPKQHKEFDSGASTIYASINIWASEEEAA